MSQDDHVQHQGLPRQRGRGDMYDPQRRATRLGPLGRGLTLEDSESSAFSASLVGGRLYRLPIEVTCKVFSGLLGSVAHYMFARNYVYSERGFVQWTALAVRV